MNFRIMAVQYTIQRFNYMYFRIMAIQYTT